MRTALPTLVVFGVILACYFITPVHAVNPYTCFGIAYNNTGYCPCIKNSGATQYNFCNQTLITQNGILGANSANPGITCDDIYAANPYLPSGIYWIRPASARPAFQAYCDMVNGNHNFHVVLIFS
jgi:hypothetical protein